MLALLSFSSLAEDVTVPVNLQAELLAKVAGYDRNFADRAGDRARVLVVTMPGESDSSRIGAQMMKSLGSISAIGGLDHDESVYSFTSAQALADVIRARRIAIVYLTPGLGDAIPAIARALDGVSVLSVASLASYVPSGAVLGFDLVSGKPKFLIHLTQARRQKVNLTSDVLKLMKVYE